MTNSTQSTASPIYPIYNHVYIGGDEEVKQYTVIYD